MYIGKHTAMYRIKYWLLETISDGRKKLHKNPNIIFWGPNAAKHNKHIIMDM